MDHYIYLTCVHLMISTIQEETLTGKADFELWADTI